MTSGCSFCARITCRNKDLHDCATFFALAFTAKKNYTTVPVRFFFARFETLVSERKQHYQQLAFISPPLRVPIMLVEHEADQHGHQSFSGWQA